MSANRAFCFAAVAMGTEKSAPKQIVACDFCYRRAAAVIELKLFSGKRKTLVIDLCVLSIQVSTSC